MAAMQGVQREGDGGGQPDAVPTRLASNRPNKGREEGDHPNQRKEMQGRTVKEILRVLTEQQRKGAEGLNTVTTIQGATQVAHDLLAALSQVEKIFTTRLRTPPPTTTAQGRLGALQAVLQKLNAMEKKMEGTRVRIQEKEGQGGPRTWSQVAAKGISQPARVELRLEETEGTKGETTQAQLERIRVVIPDARAIITHPRSVHKVLVVVRDTTRRDQIIQSGLLGAEGMKLIRKPHLVMVSSIPLNTPIKNSKCAENKEWIAQAYSCNLGIRIERVAWLYSDKNLKSRRDGGKQTKGSLLMNVGTEENQRKLVKSGFLMGAEWHPAQLWDISLTDGQCFKCWKWGHTQSVCNATKEACGHCARDHATRSCKSTNELKASYACCKQKGHKA
ncbi:uncharacterized protein M421DRAFT_300781 [Didymella exigua CBS 183.55]|uniref:CCHC-type domain-containing protein n=1 Tax=Didymella exigua CBS 183.55 TaxID=1150837 RepID=A0A6A5R6X9_9PLEO|nr:uncharacterized protein M421DRAFT_300781 [Didymella exigua CBS 183.55]KAF1923905.1 hypothetical protein M421DRAFT_300781 [Didymella exigua CBS 183.55]